MPSALDVLAGERRRADRNAVDDDLGARRARRDLERSARSARHRRRLPPRRASRPRPCRPRPASRRLGLGRLGRLGVAALRFVAGGLLLGRRPRRASPSRRPSRSPRARGAASALSDLAAGFSRRPPPWRSPASRRPCRRPCRSWRSASSGLGGAVFAGASRPRGLRSAPRPRRRHRSPSRERAGRRGVGGGLGHLTARPGAAPPRPPRPPRPRASRASRLTYRRRSGGARADDQRSRAPSTGPCRARACSGASLRKRPLSVAARPVGRDPHRHAGHGLSGASPDAAGLLAGEAAGLLGGGAARLRGRRRARVDQRRERRIQRRRGRGLARPCRSRRPGRARGHIAAHRIDGAPLGQLAVALGRRRNVRSRAAPCALARDRVVRRRTPAPRSHRTRASGRRRRSASRPTGRSTVGRDVGSDGRRAALLLEDRQRLVDVVRRGRPRTAPTAPATARMPLVVRGRLKMLLEPAAPRAATGAARRRTPAIGLAGAAPVARRASANPASTSTGSGGGTPGRPAASSVANAPDGRRTAIPAPAFAIDPGATPLCCRRIFSSRIVSSVVWLSGVSRSKRTPMPGRHARARGVVLADPDDRAVALEQRRRVDQLEVELQARADRQRLARPDEDSAAAHIDAVAFDELLRGSRCET